MKSTLTLPPASRRLTQIVIWVFPLVALGGIVYWMLSGDPFRLAPQGLPPIEDLSFQRALVTSDGFELEIVNSGPDPVTIAQVSVDDAYWNFTLDPAGPLPRLGRARLTINYPWVRAEPHTISLVTSTGLTFSHTIDLAVPSPRPAAREFFAYGLLGVYVGIIPVGLGMLWFPAMRKLGRKGLGVILALTLGLLVFLLADTLVEALEVAAELPGTFQGIPLVVFSALAAWLAILAASRRGESREGSDPRMRLAGLIALGIGLHNLGEGLAIGAAYALGEAALGSFLVVGFTLHNITEGVGIAAPLTQASPSIRRMAALALLAGAPAILGAWIGGFAFSPILAAVFLGVGAGAIIQVVAEVSGMMLRQARNAGESAFTWANLAGFLAGIAIMYLTAFLVK
jgi:zinc transporter ZupT